MANAYVTYCQAVILTIVAILSDYVAAEECGHEELAACARPLRLLTETSELSFVTKKSELKSLCPDLHAGLHCIRSYTRKCMTMAQRNHFNKLYHGTGDIVHELCEEGPYQEDFLRHAPCMREVKSEYELCSKRYQTVMDQIMQSSMYQPHVNGPQFDDEYQQRHDQFHKPDKEYLEQLEAQKRYEMEQELLKQQFPAMHKYLGDQLNITMRRNRTTGDDISDQESMKSVCCAFREYLACSEHTVRRTCGNDAAYFTRNFLGKISSSLIRMHCDRFEVLPGSCGEPYRNSATSISLYGSFAITLTTMFGTLFVANIGHLI